MWPEALVVLASGLPPDCGMWWVLPLMVGPSSGASVDAPSLLSLLVHMPSGLFPSTTVQAAFPILICQVGL